MVVSRKCKIRRLVGARLKVTEPLCDDLPYLCEEVDAGSTVGEAVRG
jgi:hypothetical protein